MRRRDRRNLQAVIQRAWQHDPLVHLHHAADRAEVADAVETIIRTYLEVREGEEESFLDCYRRVGMAPFKAALYPAKEKAA